MVITTHMYNQIIEENQKLPTKKISEDHDSSLIKAFLKDSKNFEKTPKTVISSNS